ncbi:MAG: orotidine-5'-phosphate decarboxylase [Verrucomicrobiaceae bacterium]|nr:orotidine-5'-phosphate decarboxylase [Verrucomicrobiaceae bacterium]
MDFRQKLTARIAASGSNLCVGLDIRADAADDATKRQIIQIIEETAPFAAAYKPNAAYFEALGWQGLKMLSEVLKAIPADIPVVYDVKRGDIGETQGYYAKACFDQLGVDAVTLNPFMGRDTLEPFLKYADKGLYLLAVTSNPGAVDIELQSILSVKEFGGAVVGRLIPQPPREAEAHADNEGQSRSRGDSGGACGSKRPADEKSRQVFEIVAEMTKASEQAGLVVGLTNASGDVLAKIPDVPLLIPGLGAQGGDLAALKGSVRRAPLLVNVSRGITAASDDLTFGSRAKMWKDKIADALSA